MTLDTVTPVRLAGRLRTLVPEIAAARARGVEWKQIAEAIGPQVGVTPDPADGGRGAALKIRQGYYQSVRLIENGKLAQPEIQATPAGKPTTTARDPSGFGREKPRNPIFDDDSPR